MTVVPGAGRTPNLVMLVGEAPGREEAARGQPFVGKSGREQDWYLARSGLSSRTFYRTNVVKEYRPGNPDPTARQIREWSPVLQDEIVEVAPALVVAVGRFAARWFLGDDADMESVHGLPHLAGAFDPTRVDRAGGAVVLPVYHPAAGFYDNSARATIAWDYEQLAGVYHQVKRGGRPTTRTAATIDEVYRSVTGDELADELADAGAAVVGLDTEGTLDDPWSIQVAVDPGRAYVLKMDARGADRGVAVLQALADTGALVVLHNAMFDLSMARAMGLDLRDAKVYDTMYAAYLLRLEPQGLKALAWRWCGMRMASYRETIGDVARDQQVDYLTEVLDHEWAKPEPRAIVENDGSSRLYRPQPVGRRAEKILIDLYAGKVDKDGEPVDVLARWRMVDGELRSQVEDVLGPMPIGTLGDLPTDEAVTYSARDADATLRLYFAIDRQLAKQGLGDLMAQGMEVLPIFEEMQATGMPASRVYFEALADEMTTDMGKLQARLSHRHFGDRPFNPGSPKHVGALLRRRGLTGAKRTSTGAVSTGKGSIEHLRYKDEAIGAVFDWREHRHVRDSFCAPVLARIPEGEDVWPVRCNLKVTRTATRRLASSDPNLLAVPIRSALGRRVRDGYRCPDGQLFGAWDLSQIEMRVMAHESADPLLCDLFVTGRDVHSETAAAIFGVPLDEVDKVTQRTPAKSAGFGIIYGIGGSGLLTQLRTLGIEGWDVARCDDLIKEWLRVYGGVADYIASTQAEVRRTGLVRDHWGMVRYLPGIWSNDPKVAAEAGRIAVSHRIQGGAQGMIQRSMAWLRPEIRALQDLGLGVHWCLQIHDEVVLRFDELLWKVIDPLVMEALVDHPGIELRVPVEAEGHRSTTWGGLK
jgi:uracil-DNA glycosylase family 4